jgi:hypothetical protein
MYTRTDATHRIALERLARLVEEWLQLRGMAREAAAALVASDYAGNVDKPSDKIAKTKPAAAPERQARHLAA